MRRQDSSNTVLIYCFSGHMMKMSPLSWLEKRFALKHENGCKYLRMSTSSVHMVIKKFIIIIYSGLSHFSNINKERLLLGIKVYIRCYLITG